MSDGTRLIVKDETEILIPKALREEMTRVLHLSHSGDISMMIQAKSKIFWPGMKRDLKKIYDECPTCQENKASKANEHNEIAQDDIFENFIPGQMVELDYAEKGSNSYLMIICALTGFMQAYKTSNKDLVITIRETLHSKKRHRACIQTDMGRRTCNVRSTCYT